MAAYSGACLCVKYDLDGLSSLGFSFCLRQLYVQRRLGKPRAPRHVFRGLVFRGLVFRSLIPRGLVFRGLVLRGLVFRSLIPRGLVLRGLVFKGLERYCFQRPFL